MINNIETKDKVFTIFEYVGLVNAGLKNFSAKIIGEVSEAKIAIR